MPRPVVVADAQRHSELPPATGAQSGQGARHAWAMFSEIRPDRLLVVQIGAEAVSDAVRDANSIIDTFLMGEFVRRSL